MSLILSPQFQYEEEEEEESKEEKAEILPIAVIIDLICILLFFDDQSCVTYLIRKTMSFYLQYNDNCNVYIVE